MLWFIFSFPTELVWRMEKSMDWLDLFFICQAFHTCHWWETSRGKSALYLQKEQIFTVKKRKWPGVQGASANRQAYTLKMRRRERYMGNASSCCKPACSPLYPSILEYPRTPFICQHAQNHILLRQKEETDFAHLYELWSKCVFECFWCYALKSLEWAFLSEVRHTWTALM